MSKTILDVGIKDKNGSLVTLDLDEGGTNNVLIIGSTGSGKTNLLKNILAKIDPDSALFAFVFDGDDNDISKSTKAEQIILDGTVPKFSNRVMFTLNIRNGESRQSSFDTLEAVWQRINELPRETEAFENLVRMGRKLNVRVILALQSFEGVDDSRLEIFQNFGIRVIQMLFNDHRAKIVKSGIADQGDFVDNIKSGVLITPKGKTTVDFR